QPASSGEGMKMETPRTNRTIQTASHWGVYNVEVDARGQVVRTTPFQSDLTACVQRRRNEDGNATHESHDPDGFPLGRLQRRGRCARPGGADHAIQVRSDCLRPAAKE